MKKHLKKIMTPRTLLGVALMVWLGVGYDFANPWLWTAAFLVLFLPRE